MKNKHIILTSCLLLVGSAGSSFAAYTLTNGDFATNDTTGWTTSGSGVSVASGAATIVAGVKNLPRLQQWHHGND